MPAKPIEISKSKLLLVEGEDEKRFFGALITRLGLQGRIQIIPYEGKTNLNPFLKALANMPGFNKVISIGVERDSDDDPKATFRSVCDALNHAKLPVPKYPMTFVNNNPRTGVIILPDEKEDGALETVCLKSVEDDAAMPCVSKYFECLNNGNVHLPRNKREVAKAKVQVFLASRPKPGKRLGEAAEAGYWPWDDDAFAKVKSFLSGL